MNSSVFLVFGILLQIPPFSFQNLSIKLGKRTCLLGWGGEGNVLLFARLTALIKKKKTSTPPKFDTAGMCLSMASTAGLVLLL